MSPAVILSDQFLQDLIEAGIIPEETTGVIIVAKAGCLVEMHYHSFLDEDKVRVLSAAAHSALVVDATGDS